MSKIPEMPFKFKHSLSDTDYTLEGWLGAELKVSWEDSPLQGDREFVTYTVAEVMDNLSKGIWEVIQQPTQECPYSIIEELECKIDSLEDLISEQAARIRELEAGYLQDQAECYRRLNDLLKSHRSFQESNKCRSDELSDTIKLLQLCYDSRYGF